MKRGAIFVAAAAAAVLVGCAGVQRDETPTGTTGADGSKTESPAVALRIANPAAGTAVKGNVVTLDLDASGIRIVKADGDRSGASGHYHVFIDRDPVAAGATIGREPGIVHTTDDPVVLSGLSVGPHRFVVVYGDGTHARIGDTAAETTVEVAGPSVDATAPATVAAGQPVKVEVKVEGLTLVKADGDTSGATGHLHVFVDRAPTPAGAPIPVEAGIIHSPSPTIEVAGLAPGEHTLWVVAGNGAHAPLDPKVMDKLIITVS